MGMKPRSISAPWTPEDEDILLRGGRTRWAVSLRCSGLLGDINDAELMLTVQGWKFRGIGSIARYPASDGEMIDVRGGNGFDFV